MTYSDNIIDVRDIIARVEELRDMLPQTAHDVIPGTSDETEELQQECETLETLLFELRGNGGDEQWEGDWYPVTLIRDSYFEDAMDELLEDCGYITPYADRPSFIKISIDYDALQVDYTSVEFEGVTYWYR